MIFFKGNHMNSNFQTDLKIIDGDTVSCKGEGWSNSHPLIYLDLSSGKTILCPYCGLRFKKK
ncbi:MAG: zinc-finger domain-containing protein [Rickettsiales bacterium]|nr:zinc-finger domain-containing protein [Rickettsiales bacterium]|tara:strand:+ start:582 stop:767 length:186 start_codon:yes stop_codon:yes gene_type:complete